MALLVIATIAIIAWAPRFADYLQRDGRWHPTHDGRMRRWVGGGWNYRDMTEDEALDRLI